ncbi:spexin prohormone 2 isoform 3-T3 [Acanthopagrus schlegelii]
MHTSAFYAGGEISPVKELNTTLPGYERDNNVHNGPAGTYVWAGPPPHVSLPGVIPHHYQSTNKPGTVDTPCLRFPCSCQSTQCQVTYPDYHLEPQSSQYHIVTGPVPGPPDSNQHGLVSAPWFTNEPILCSMMPQDLHVPVAGICVPQASHPQQFHEGLSEFTSHLTHPVVCNMSGAGQVVLVNPCEPEPMLLTLKSASQNRCNSPIQEKDVSALGTPSQSCLGRNPDAFRSKVAGGKSGGVKGWHNKGCNCKRSGCLKNYCECYEANIKCTSSCKCVGCSNFLNSTEMGLKEKFVNGNKSPVSVISPAVVEAVCGCQLARAKEAEREAQSPSQAEHMVLDEFGHCLTQIVVAMFQNKTH